MMIIKNLVEHYKLIKMNVGVNTLAEIFFERTQTAGKRDDMYCVMICIGDHFLCFFA